MNKIKYILKTQFSIECIGITEIQCGLPTINYKIETDAKNFFLKIYDKKKVQASLWIEKIDY